MTRNLCLIAPIALLAGCGLQAYDAPEPLPPPFTTDDPSGLFPESPTANLHTGAYRAFILEKREFVLGEPIVVEFRTWPRDKERTFQHIGGSDRMFGRDNTFAFLMRSESGTWLTGPQPGSDRGGLFGGQWATDEQPIQVYNAIQRWCVINAPGVYDLYCFFQENAMPPNSEPCIGASVDGKMESVAWLPGPVKEWLHETQKETFTSLQRMTEESDFESEYFRWDTRWRLVDTIRSSHDFAHFRIAIQEGTAQDGEAMVSAWLERIDRETASLDREKAHVKNRMGGALEGVYFNQTSCWIPTQVARAEEGKLSLLNGMYVGVLLNPHPEVKRAALQYPDSLLEYWTTYPRPPGLVAQLKRIANSDPDSEIRTRAATWLSKIAPAVPSTKQP